MASDIISKIDKAIRFSFYFLFFLVPLVMWPDTFELFEFNKMWLVFGMTIIITFLWAAKMIAEKRFRIRRTPLDIPIALFFLSQLISTLFSMDPHVSFWGYYSRFNGGLLSTIAYLTLYYAFATNLIPDANEKDKPHTPASYKLLFVSLISGLVVTLWGLPGHFGADPTCFVFRGSFDVSCWTDQFQPTVRIYSTLGQPNWFGTYLAALLPIALGFGIYSFGNWKNKFGPILYLVLAFLFFVALLYSRSQSSFLGLVIGLAIFSFFILFRDIKRVGKKVLTDNIFRYLAAAVIVFAVVAFFIETPIDSLNKFVTLRGVKNVLQIAQPAPVTKVIRSEGLESPTNIQLGGTESSKIRLVVWQGALELFKRNPVFGTGVETFAYAYYQVKPLAHNLTSEWDFLYNKAHNEYLNYLATTGAFGFGTYMAFILMFLFISVKTLLKREGEYYAISAGILGGWVAILISNFFGFSVVVINLFLFIFPLLFLELENRKTLTKVYGARGEHNMSSVRLSPPQTIAIVFLGLIALYYEFYLLNFWNADRKYALGNNLDKASEYVQAYPHLVEAAKMLPSENLYKDELSINMATLSLLLAEQNQATQAAQFGMQAKALSDEVTNAHPNNVVFLKTRARVAFALSGINPAGVNLAIETIERARKLAPTDAKLVYNEGLFYQQLGEEDRAIAFLREAIRIKPNYIDAYYSLGAYYAELAKRGDAQSAEYVDEAKKALRYLLTNLDPNHKASLDLLKTL